MHHVKKRLTVFIFSQWAIKHHESKLSNLLTSRFCLCSSVNNFYSHQPSICANKSDWRRVTAAKPLQNQQVEYWNISFIAPHSRLSLVCTGAAKRCCCAPIENELVILLALSIRYMSCTHSEKVYAFTRHPWVSNLQAHSRAIKHYLVLCLHVHAECYHHRITQPPGSNSSFFVSIKWDMRIKSEIKSLSPAYFTWKACFDAL